MALLSLRGKQVFTGEIMNCFQIICGETETKQNSLCVDICRNWVIKVQEGVIIYYSIFNMFDIFQMKKVIKETHAFQSCSNSSNKLAFWAWVGL